MKIDFINESKIVFDNGNEITFDHDQECCEHNYADFLYLKEDDGIYDIEFDENLKFEVVPNAGIRFGSVSMNMVFVPCYSKQNGWYTSNVDIYYKRKMVSLNAPYLEEN